MMGGLSLGVDPVLPFWLLALFAALAAILVLAALLSRARGGAMRAGFMALLAVALAGPQILRESRTPLDDVVLALIDRSPSNRLDARTEQTDRALALLRRRVQESGAELRVIETEPDASRTDVFGPLAEAIATVPRERLSAAVVVSDGRIDDAGHAAALRAAGRPVHGLLTGDPEMIDRRVEILRAPEYAMVGRPVTVRLRVVEENFRSEGPLALSLRGVDGERQTRQVRAGEPVEITLTPERRGEMLVDLAVAPAEGERVTVNNRALLSINAVRDRLRVLLISGEPHPGERVWRATLKSDPAVDLIHFTILRLPTSQDPTPVSQLSLIPFPTERLFAEQLEDFDLVIFDRYSLRGVLELRYFDNLMAYVRNGGAVFVANGPEFAGDASLHRTPLADILPAEPTGEVLMQGYSARLTGLGRRHPVTRPLGGGGTGESPDWGRWFRLIDSRVADGRILMTGAGGAPLLVLDEVAEGRIAQLMTDHVWLWARGIEGGGPYQELLRRSVHWLMKEPELEDERLIVRGQASRLVIERRSLEPGEHVLVVEGPDDFEHTLSLRTDAEGVARTTLPVPAFGLYRVSEGEGALTALAAVGPTGGHELSRVVPTAERLRPLAEATGGGIYWLQEGMPEIRRPGPKAEAAGSGWLGLPRRGASRLDALEQQPLLPGWAWLLLLGGLLAAAWWREAK